MFNVPSLIKIAQFSGEGGLELKEEAKSSTGILPISVGQAYHEGEEWAATIHLASATFQRCIIVVADTLQLYTEMMTNGPYIEKIALAWALENQLITTEAARVYIEAEESGNSLDDIVESQKSLLADATTADLDALRNQEQAPSIDSNNNSMQDQEEANKLVKNLMKHVAHARTLKAGDEWLKRNEHITARLTIPFTISRWDEWVDESIYSPYREAINHDYKKNRAFHSAVDIVTKQFINGFERRQEKNSSTDLIDFDLKKASELSKQYVLEELAVLDIWKNNPAVHLLGQDVNERFFNVYPFGNSSLNTAVLNCFKQRLGDSMTLRLLILTKDEPSKKAQAKHKTKDKNPPRNTALVVTHPEVTAEEVRDMQQALRFTLRVSKLTVEQQIAALQGIEKELLETTPSNNEIHYPETTPTQTSVSSNQTLNIPGAVFTPKTNSSEDLNRSPSKTQTNTV